MYIYIIQGEKQLKSKKILYRLKLHPRVLIFYPFLKIPN